MCLHCRLATVETPCGNIAAQNVRDTTKLLLASPCSFSCGSGFAHLEQHSTLHCSPSHCNTHFPSHVHHHLYGVSEHLQVNPSSQDAGWVQLHLHFWFQISNCRKISFTPCLQPLPPLEVQYLFLVQ